jgi:5'-3' exonuclease
MKKTLRNLRCGDVIYALISNYHVSTVKINDIISSKDYASFLFGDKQIIAYNGDLDATTVNDKNVEYYLNKEDLIRALEIQVDVLRLQIIKLKEVDYDNR